MNELNTQHNSETFPVAIIVSRFNKKVTSALLEGALQRLREKGFAEEAITVVHVPGAVEIPLVAQRLAKSQRYSAIITLGAVIRGETSHYDYVCEQVSQGCQRVAMEHDIPVIFGILTTENGAQAMARAGGGHSHKGIESVDCAQEMVALLKQLH